MAARLETIPRRAVWLAPAFLALLVSTDLLFVGLHLLHTHTGLAVDPSFSVERDRGFGEVFQYVKYFWTLLLFVGVWWLTGARVYEVWAVVYAYFLLDDAVELHEVLGLALASGLSLPAGAGLRPEDFGELLSTAGMGLVFVLLLGVAYWRASPQGRAASRDLAVLTGLLVFFGVGVDALHGVLGGQAEGSPWGVLEDGGELLAMSLVAAYAMSLLEGRGASPYSPWRWLAGRFSRKPW